MNFLFILCLLGILFAVYQDFTRREIDDWLNLFIFFSGVLFLLIENILNSSSSVVLFGFFVFIVSLFSFGFYYAHFFSGGDSKLFFAVSPILFVSSISFFYNIAIFIFLLFFCGSVYSITYSLVLFFGEFEKNKKVFLIELKKKGNIFLVLFGIVFLFASLFVKVLIFFSLFIFLFVLLLSFAKTLESTSMKRKVSTKNLREGDWLFEDIKVGKKIFKKSWDGLTSEDLKYLKKFDKVVFVKDGIPYAPAFLFALIVFVFRDYLLGIIFS